MDLLSVCWRFSVEDVLPVTLVLQRRCNIMCIESNRGWNVGKHEERMVGGQRAMWLCDREKGKLTYRTNTSTH